MKNGCITDSDGTREWYLNGERHREDGPAREWADGDREWWLNGVKHREDGPAIEWAHGDRYWYLNGKLHREDGPAIEWADGDRWYFKGTNVPIPKCRHKKRSDPICPTCLKNFRDKSKLLLIKSVQES